MKKAGVMGLQMLFSSELNNKVEAFPICIAYV